MTYILIFLSCKGLICTPIFAEPKATPDICFEQARNMPNRTDMKALCIPLIHKEVPAKDTE